MNSLRVLLLLSLILTPSFAWAAVDDPKSFSENIMKMVLNGELDKANDQLDLALPKREGLFTPIKDSYKEFGSPLFIDLLREEMLGSSIFEQIYLVRWDKKAMVFRLRFIKGNGGWFLWGLKYSNEGERILWPGSD